MVLSSFGNHEHILSKNGCNTPSDQIKSVLRSYLNICLDTFPVRRPL